MMKADGIHFLLFQEKGNFRKKNTQIYNLVYNCQRPIFFLTVTFHALRIATRNFNKKNWTENKKKRALLKIYFRLRFMASKIVFSCEIKFQFWPRTTSAHNAL